MTGIIADYNTLLRQAHMTAGEYLDAGVKDIDAALGAGYAAKHSELLAAYMKTAALDLMATTLAKEIGGAIERVAEAIEGDRSDNLRDDGVPVS